MLNNIKIYGETEEKTVAQLERCLEAEEGSLGVLCADNHLGYSQPIGGVVAYENLISPSGVGYDIACGNAAARTPLKATEVPVASVLDEIERTVSFGMGRSRRQKTVEHPVLDRIAESPVAEQRALFDLAYKQLGTVGSGNHYVDLFEDEEGYLWIGVHFGSRGFGHKTATHFLHVAKEEMTTDKRLGKTNKVSGPEGMDSPPAVLRTDSEAGQAYIEAMMIAGEYAYAGRDFVISTILGILQTNTTDYVHNHHNFAWLEEHDDRALWVIRKGATPAQPGQRGFVGGSMGDVSVILEGNEIDEDGLLSTVHGAGRVMSRSRARGKVKYRKVYQCSDRDCDYSVPAKNFKGKKEHCPYHANTRWLKHTEQDLIRPGEIDWPTVREEIRERGIDIRGGGADEAPGVYKRLPEVLEAHGNTIRILHTLKPLGVIMAGADVVDPFRD